MAGKAKVGVERPRSSMAKSHLLVGETTISYTVVRSPRRKKTIHITVDPREGVLITAPVRTTRGQIADIVRRRAQWIMEASERIAARRAPEELRSGEAVPYLGRPVPLLVQPHSSKRVMIALQPSLFGGTGVAAEPLRPISLNLPEVVGHPGYLLVMVPRGLGDRAQQEAIQDGLARWYSQRAAEWVRERVQHWALAGGYRPGRVLVRNQRTRWGSCAPDGTLRFNWRVMLAEPAIIDYVVVHELAHLRVRNHSSQFWQEVERVMPDYAARRRRLKELEPFLII